MKTLILVLALAALVALSSAKPHKGHGGKSKDRGDPGRHHRNPCKVVYNNGTEVLGNCSEFGGLFVCEEVDLTQYPEKARRYENATALSYCVAKQCTSAADCYTVDENSVCSNKPVRPDQEAMQTLMESCFPGRPQRPERPEKADRSDSDLDEDDDDQEDDTRPMRCSIPPAVYIAKRACRVDYAGKDYGTPCRSYRGTERTCNATAACTVSISGTDATLYFCERPERSSATSGQTRGGRSRSSGDDASQTGQNQRQSGRQNGGRRQNGGGNGRQNGGSTGSQNGGGTGSQNGGGNGRQNGGGNGRQNGRGTGRQNGGGTGSQNGGGTGRQNGGNQPNDENPEP